MAKQKEVVAGAFDILPMQRGDIPRVAELERRNFSVPWSTQSFQSVVEDPFSYCFVGVLGGRIVAYTVFGAIDDYAELWNIAVDPDYRGRGLGDTMLRYVIGCCRGLGVSSLFLQVRKSNQVALKLYEKHGFVFVMVQKNYYTIPREDAHVYRLDVQAQR
jgi:ribosomal-protein-alanine N-acetyltransferase